MKKLLIALFLMLSFSTTVFADTTQMMDNAGQATKDTAITTQVKVLLFEKKLFNDENFNPLDVHVTTNDNIVTLTGKVKTEEEKARAAEITQSAKGVKSVDNQLVVQ